VADGPFKCGERRAGGSEADAVGERYLLIKHGKSLEIGGNQLMVSGAGLKDRTVLYVFSFS